MFIPQGHRLVKSGTFTQANSRMSLVDGTAFFDCGVDLSTYAGLDTGSHEYLIKVYDDDGYSIQGYVGAVGGGEAKNTTFSDDCSADNTGNWALDDCTLNFVAANGDVAHYTIDYASYSQTLRYSITPGDKKLYKLSTTFRDGTTSGQAGIRYGLYISFGGNNVYLPSITTTAGWVTDSGYLISSGQTRVETKLNLPSGNIKVKDILLDEITDCAATGFHIISAQGGSTQNWTSESASFNYNDSDGYSYKIWKVR